MQKLIDGVKAMRNNRLGNYIVPGLSSELLGGPEHGKVRIFSASRDTRDSITPHSHRFSFTCLVLVGTVRNAVYREVAQDSDLGSLWIRSSITQVCGLDGIRNFAHAREETPKRYFPEVRTYQAGETYAMDYRDIHSITFTQGSEVLFFEGPTVQSWDWMIEPYVDGKLVPTFKTEPWMFQRS